MSKDNSNDTLDKNTKVVIEKAKLDGILKRLSTLEQDNQGVKELKQVKKHTARIRYLNDKLVIGFKERNYIVYDEKRRTDELWCNLILTDGKKESNFKMPFKEFQVTAKVEEVEIIKEDVKLNEETLGTVEARQIQDFTMEGDGTEVPVVIVTPEVTVTIKAPKIGEIQVSNNILNI